MSSIFSRIFPCRQSEGRTPHEDFFTEVFASVSNDSELFGREFAKWLFGIENASKPVIETQKRFGSRRPDIYVEVRDSNDRRYVAIIESKNHSAAGENQLMDYGKILTEIRPYAKSAIPVHITKFSEDIEYKESDAAEFRQCKWSDLYKKIAQARQEKPHFKAECQSPNFSTADHIQKAYAL